MSIQIRKAGEPDAGAIAALVNSAYRGDESRQGWTTEADLLDGTRIDDAAVLDLIRKPDTSVLLYIIEERVMGCVELRKDGTGLYLGMLSVAPRTQGQGIGKKLLIEAESYARKHGCTSIFMTVISVREDLIAWYLRHGYMLTGKRMPFVVPDERWGIPKRDLEFVYLEKKLID